jgi:hypothetical protein
MTRRRRKRTLYDLQDADDRGDSKFAHNRINFTAVNAARRDLHRLLTALGVLTVEEGLREIGDLQATARTFTKMVRNMSPDDWEWKEVKRGE